MSFNLTYALLKPSHSTVCMSELHAGAVPSTVGRQGGSVMEGNKTFVGRNISLIRSLF